MPSLAMCSITTTTRLTPATRSIAPPMPFTILPGIIQLARSPFSETCIAPRMARSICPPRIMANESALEKKLVAGKRRDGLLAGVDEVGIDLALGRERAHAEHAVLALQRHVHALGDVVGTSVGMPMPRLT